MKFPAAASDELRLRVFNEARKEFFNGGPVGIQAPWHKLSVQQLNVGGSSKTLGDNLVAIGVARPGQGTVAAHHIVPWNKGVSGSVWDQARQLLRTAGVDVNEAAKGVFLPRDARFANPGLGVTHSGVHTERYGAELLQRLQSVSPNPYRDELQKIAAELVEGTFLY